MSLNDSGEHNSQGFRTSYENEEIARSQVSVSVGNILSNRVAAGPQIRGRLLNASNRRTSSNRHYFDCECRHEKWRTSSDEAPEFLDWTSWWRAILILSSQRPAFDISKSTFSFDDNTIDELDIALEPTSDMDSDSRWSQAWTILDFDNPNLWNRSGICGRGPFQPGAFFYLQSK